MLVQGSAVRQTALGRQAAARLEAVRPGAADPAQVGGVEIPAVRVTISAAGRGALWQGNAARQAAGRQSDVGANAAQETGDVRVRRSTAAWQFSQDEKTAGPASARLHALATEEAERQRKLDYMHSLEARLQDETLTDEDRKTLQADVAWFKKETMTNRDKIEALTAEMHGLEKKSEAEGWSFEAISFYKALIKPRIDWQEAHDQEVKELLGQARQETADALVEAMQQETVEAPPGGMRAQEEVAVELMQKQASLQQTIDAAGSDASDDSAANGEDRSQTSQPEPEA